MLRRFLPRDDQFFVHFRDAANNAVEVARLLAEIFGNGHDTERKVRKLRDLEHRGDEITHQIFNALNRTFITPLDREDIQALAHEIDDFVDYMEEAAKRVSLYRIQETSELAHTFTRVLSEQAESLAQMIPLVEDPRQREAMMKYTVEINRLENEADDLLSQSLASLYDNANDIPSLIKAIRWGEIYQLLEDATDRAEDVANTIEAIVMKHA